MMLNEAPLTNNPGFYKNVSGGVFRKTLGSGNINAAIIPIVKRITGTYSFPFGSGIGVPVKINHGLGKVYDCFVRFREEGTVAWQSCPQIDFNPAAGVPQIFKVSNITKDYIELSHFDVLGADLTTEVEIYFIEFQL